MKAAVQNEGLSEELGSHGRADECGASRPVLAITSHVPHLIAYNIVNTAAHLERVTAARSLSLEGRLSRFHAHSPSSTRPCGATSSSNKQDAVLEMLAGVLGGSDRPAEGTSLLRWTAIRVRCLRARAVRPPGSFRRPGHRSPDFGRPPDQEPRDETVLFERLQRRRRQGGSRPRGWIGSRGGDGLPIRGEPRALSPFRRCSVFLDAP